MIATMTMTETACRSTVETYLADTFGPEYHVSEGRLRNGSWRFMVVCQRADMKRNPAVSGISDDTLTGQVQALTAEQIREMSEDCFLLTLPQTQLTST